MSSIFPAVKWFCCKALVRKLLVVCLSTHPTPAHSRPTPTWQLTPDCCNVSDHLWHVSCQQELQRQRADYEARKKMAGKLRQELEKEEIGDREREERRRTAIRVQEEQKALLEARRKGDNRWRYLEHDKNLNATAVSWPRPAPHCEHIGCCGNTVGVVVWCVHVFVWMQLVSLISLGSQTVPSL